MAYSAKQIEIIFNKVLLKIEEGEALRNILKMNGMPSPSTFFKWISDPKFPEKSKRYARACEWRAECILEDILQIADDGTNDYMTITKGDIEYNVEDREVTNRSKLRVEARFKYIEKLAPSKFGQQSKIEHSGSIEQITGMKIINDEKPKTKKK